MSPKISFFFYENHLVSRPWGIWSDSIPTFSEGYWEAEVSKAEIVLVEDLLEMEY